MVLEEATSSSEPSPFSSDSYQQPSSDIDPYAGDRNPTVLQSRDSSYFLVAPGIYINAANLPKPILIGSMYDAKLAEITAKTCTMAADVLGRPVTQEEANAFALNYAQGSRTQSWGSPVGVGIGALLASRGAEKMKFPLWTPDPEKWKFESFLGVRGPMARRLWNGVRVISWGFAGSIVGGIFFASYALTTATAHREMSPVLKEFNEKLRQRVRDGKKLPKYDNIPAGSGQGETAAMARQRQSVQRVQQAARTRRDDVDDMSPTGGRFGDDFVEVGSNSSSDTGLMSDAQSRSAQQQSGRQAEPSQRAPSRRYGDDNASPTAQSDATSKQGGSAWDRLRQEALSGQGQRPLRASSSDGSSSLDSFAFSSADEEKQLARSEAQKQFDARIERERSGRDFEGSGGRKGWGS